MAQTAETRALVADRGIARSLEMYYGDGSQVERLVAFYAQFIRPGELAFDVGAHVGSRIAAWTRLGARVVAVEPQEKLMRLLRAWYGHLSAVHLVEQALAARAGEQVMHVSDRTPTVTTLSTEFMAKIKQVDVVDELAWNRTVTVAVTTLDALIARHGEPVFCKIDTEGYDLEVLRGLSKPLKALSVECVPSNVEVTLACLERLGELGEYEFNWSPGESMRFELPAWAPAAAMAERLRQLPRDSNPGDVYARRRE